MSKEAPAGFNATALIASFLHKKGGEALCLSTEYFVLSRRNGGLET